MKLMHWAPALLLSAAHGALGQSAPISPEVAFGVREDIEQAALSPDGQKLSFVAPGQGQGARLLIYDFAKGGRPRPILAASGDPERFDSCRWSANDRLLCSIYGVLPFEAGTTYVDRLVSVDGASGEARLIRSKSGSGASLRAALYGGVVIDWLPDADGAVLMEQDFIPEQTTGTHLAQTGDGLGVVEMNTRTGRSRIVEQPDKDAFAYVTDGRGTVRIMGRKIKQDARGYDSGQVRYYYRLKDSRKWEPLGDFNQNSEDGFRPLAVDADANLVYGLRKNNGLQVAYSIALDGTGKETPVFAAPGVDVSGFVRIGKRRRVIGVSYVTDRREVKYIDPAFQALATSLSKAIPNLPLIRFVDSSADESKLLIWAGSDRDPGRYYLLDRTSKRMEEILPARMALGDIKLGEVKAITYRAADGTTVPAYLTLPVDRPAERLPAIVMPHGGPGARDEWGFDWLSQFFVAKGYAVIQPNFRGSSGYGDDWFQKNGFQSWPTAIGDVADAGRYLVKEGIADPAKLAIVGWSYGGYAALQTAATAPDLFRAAIAIAPVTDLEVLRHQFDNWSNYAVVSRFIGTGPHVTSGSPARRAKDIRIPVLMFHGTLDQNVAVAHSKLMEERLRSAGAKPELVTYDKLDHYLEDSRARIDMLTRSDAFIRKALGLN